MRYEIKIKFDSPISFTHKPIFDGILYGSYCRWVLLTQEGRKHYLVHLKTRDVAHWEWISTLPILTVFPQPIQIQEHELLSTDGLPIVSEKGIFQSSIMSNENGVQDVIKFRKRFRGNMASLAGFSGRKKKVRINNGQFKSYDLPFATQFISEGSFVFKSEDLKLVKFLMDNVFGIGKKRNRGVGKIRSYSITESDKKIQRPVPIKETDLLNFKGEIKATFQTWKPPYFHSPNNSFCEMVFI